MKRSVFILILPFLTTIGMAQNAFELSRSERSSLIDKAHVAVKSYSLSLLDMGDPTYKYYEKDPFRTDILDLFHSRDTEVLNDIDAAGNLSKDISISTYLNDILDRYRNHGVVIKTEIDLAKSNNLFVADQPGEKYFFVKVVAERTVKGIDNLDRAIDQTRLIDIYVLYAISEKGFDLNPYIYSVVEHDENTVYTEVGIIGEPQRAVVQTSAPAATQPPSTVVETSIPSQETKTTSTNIQTANCPPGEAIFKPADPQAGWDDFVYSSYVYRTAVQQNGISGDATLFFTVKADGSIENPTISPQSESLLGKKLQLLSVAKQLMEESTSNGNKWIAATKNCVAIDAYPSKTIVFARNRVKEKKATSSSNQPCNQPDAPAHYIAPEGMGSRDAWKAFYQQDTEFIQAVSDGLRGKVSSSFIVNANGTLDLRNVENQFVEVSDSNRIKVLVNGLLTRSAQQGDGWNPRKKDCQSVLGEASVPIVFELPEITPVSRKMVSEPQLPQEPLTKKEQKRADRQERKEARSCEKENRGPKFNSCRHHKRAWKEYVGKQPEFVRAVLRDKARGRAKAKFSVTAKGMVEAGTADIKLGEDTREWDRIMETAQQVLEESNKERKWKPALENGIPVERKTFVKFHFNKRSVDPNAAIESKLLSERGEKKMARKADWIEHKKEKIGGVHFSIGGGYAVPLSNQGLQGGVAEASFGGLFGHFVGMEAKYRATINSQDTGFLDQFLSENSTDSVNVGKLEEGDASTLLHVISGGFIFNTSKKRVRPYFTLHGGINWLNIDASRVKVSDNDGSNVESGTIKRSTQIGGHFSPGFGIDFKIPNYGSFFVAGAVSMNWLVPGTINLNVAGTSDKRTITTDTAQPYLAVSIPITIGFRFSRW